MGTIDERTFVYAIGSEDGPVKVGITQNIGSRLRVLQTGSPQKLELIWIYTASHRQEAIDMERQFHEVHADQRLAGEWFDISAELAAESLETQIEFNYGPFAKQFFARRYEGQP